MAEGNEKMYIGGRATALPANRAVLPLLPQQQTKFSDCLEAATKDVTLPVLLLARSE
jgi:hypothetical protein